MLKPITQILLSSQMNESFDISSNLLPITNYPLPNRFDISSNLLSITYYPLPKINCFRFISVSRKTLGAKLINAPYVIAPIPIRSHHSAHWRTSWLASTLDRDALYSKVFSSVNIL
jgi:hypothetical protein